MTMFHSLRERERALSLWIQDRLHERAAIEWATNALKRVHGGLGNELITLFAFLDEHAQKNTSLQHQFKKIWQLLHTAARESGGGHGGQEAFELRQQLKAGNLQPDIANKIVDMVRPRLHAEELSTWANREEGRQDDPLRWVAWNFKARAGSLNKFEAKFERDELQNLSSGVLLRIVERGTDALADAQRLAGELGWLDRGVDLPNAFVRRVVTPSAAEIAAAEVDDDEQDPDAYDDNFAPIARLISGAFECLAKLDINSARNVCGRWDEQSGGLFIRLAAFARWDPNIRDAAEVARFVERLAEPPFWRWMSYPEVATLRAMRWKELPSGPRSRIEARLLQGPSADAFGDHADLEKIAFEYHRDHELARLVDAGADVTAEARILVEQRRQHDPDFPKNVPAFERGQEGIRVTQVPDGDAAKFNDVPPESLLPALLQSSGRRHFGEGDHAHAFSRTLAGKAKILAALRLADIASEAAEAGWQLLLSYPPQKTDDAATVRPLAEEIAGLALQLLPARFGPLTDRLSYWLDQADEVAPDFAGGKELWNALAPLAAELANKPAEEPASEKKPEAVDLTGAALNEPLGHLISMFLRRCPTMPGQGERPPLPVNFTGPLKTLTGRASELLANRMAVHMRYFELADGAWLNALVLEPMTSERPEGERAWEAFARYGQLPPPSIWTRLEPFIFRRLASGRLSPEGRRRVAEMAVIVWSWSKDSEQSYTINATGLRSALGLAADDVRTQAAWHFQGLFRRSRAKDEGEEKSETWPRLGKAFFAEIWPLEPALQSPNSSNHFAGVPGNVGARHFAEAVDTVLPFLRPFDVWSIESEFWLGKEPDPESVVEAHPEATLRLLSACISPTQQHRVMELKQLLDRIVESESRLQSDARVRLLRRLSGD